MDAYEYGFNLGFEAGKDARRLGIKDHGDLLSTNDPYAMGYRKGLNLPDIGQNKEE